LVETIVFVGGESSGNTGGFQPDFSGGAFGFQSSGGLNGFRPAGSTEEGGSTNWGFRPPASGSPGMQGEGDDYLDEEERERVLRV